MMFRQGSGLSLLSDDCDPDLSKPLLTRRNSKIAVEDYDHTSTIGTIVQMLNAIKTKDHDTLHLVQVFHDFRWGLHQKIKNLVLLSGH